MSNSKKISYSDLDKLSLRNNKVRTKTKTFKINIMNKQTFYLLILMILVPLFSYSQGWEKTYDGGFIENTKSADLTLDGGVIIAGTQTDNSTGISYTFLYKTDTEGNLLWEYYDSTRIGTFVNTMEVKSTSDGHYIVSSLFGNNPPNNANSVRKISDDGTIIWDNTFSNAFGGVAIDGISEMADGSYLMIGQGDDSSGQVSTSIFKVDVNGDVIWSNSFNLNDEPTFPGKAVEAANGDIVMSGYFGYANNDQNAYVRRFDAAGLMIWELEYNNTDNDFSGDIIEMDNGDFVIGGFASTDFSLWTPSLQRIDGTGNQIWYELYHDYGQQFAVLSIKKTADEGIVLGGTSTLFSNGVNDYYLLKTDSNGTEEWGNTYGRADEDNLYDLLIAPDHGFYLAGYTRLGSNNKDVYLVKTDSSGNSLINLLSGNVFHDEDVSCDLSTGEIGLEQWLVEASKGDIRYMSVTDAIGDYSFNLDTGLYEVTAYPISPYWGFCDTTYTANFSNIGDTITQDFAALVLIECPYMEVSIGTPFLRRCFENTYYVQYCNYGTIAGEDAHVEIVLDPFMEYIESSISLN